MKKVTILIITFIILFSFIGCNKNDKKTNELESQISELQSKVDEHEEKINNTEEPNTTAKESHNKPSNKIDDKNNENTTNSNNDSLSTNDNTSITTTNSNETSKSTSNIKTTTSKKHTTTSANYTTTTTTKLVTEQGTGYRLALSLEKDIIKYLEQKGFSYEQPEVIYSPDTYPATLNYEYIPTAYNSLSYEENLAFCCSQLDKVIATRTKAPARFYIQRSHTYSSSSKDAKTNYNVFFENAK